MGFLKFLFIAILILWIIRVLVRMIFPVMVRKAFGTMPGQGDYGQQQQQQRSRKPEGSISIDYMPNKKDKKGNADKLGDFVDFEEVK